MSITATQTRTQAGFTLVELAIVLVIIGLIIGGVLVGQDMIKGAEVRATAGQFEKYSSAVNTFKDKYMAIPGDMTSVQATQFGVTNPGTTFRAGAAGQSDGNGLLQGCSSVTTGAGTGFSIGCETVLLWTDLSWASLVDGSFSSAVASTAPQAIAATAIPNFLPGARMGRGNYIHAYADGGYNFFQVGGFGAQTATNLTINATITPQEAFNMDTKLDDGRPNTGATQARAAAGATGTFATVVNAAPSTGTTAGSCTDANATVNLRQYQTSDQTLAGTPACSLRVRFN